MKLTNIAAVAVLSVSPMMAQALDVHSERLAQPFKAVVMGHSFVAPIAEDFGSTIEDNAAFSQYDQEVYGCGGAGGDPLSLWRTPCTRKGADNPMELTEKERIQDALDAGDVDLLVMTYHPDVHSLAGHRLWIDYAKAQNPNTTFAIALPWATEPCAWDSNTLSDYELFDDSLVQPSIDRLEQEKEVTIFFIAHGYAPMELAEIYFDANHAQHSALRTDVQAFSLHRDTSSAQCQRRPNQGDQALFRDQLGHSMSLSRRAAALAFGASIFDLSFDSYVDEYVTDLGAIATDVIQSTDSRHPTHKSPWRD